MELQININPLELLSEAENYFSVSFCNDLQLQKPWTYTESLVARYLIEKNKNLQGAKDPCYSFSSISHKKNLVFIATSDNKIWVDIEIYKQRWIDLLDTFSDGEYSILWWKNWDNFYILWTAKESCIKFLNLKLEDMKWISLISSQKSEYIFSNLKFFSKHALEYYNNKITVYSWWDWEIIYSICI